MITLSPRAFIATIAQEGRLLAIDVGGRNVGIAMSDTNRIIATPYATLTLKSKGHTKEYFTKLTREFTFAGAVVGWPLSMQGEEGSATELVKQFLPSLTPFCKHILLYDERLSTKAVTRDMQRAGLNRKDRTTLDNHLAATYILQGAMDAFRLQA
jgi:putative Holliday junction resolvase